MKTKSIILLALFILFGLFLRFYNLNNSFTFSMDEEYQATYAQTLVKDPHPIWIGVSQADTGFYLGPYMTYLTAILLYIGNGNPIITGYFASFIGVFTAYVLYFFTQKIFTKKHGLIAAFLYLFSPLMIYFDQRFWNPSILPLLSITIFGSFVLAFKNPLWLLLTSFTYGLAFHSHLSLIPMLLLVIIYIKNKKKKLNYKIIIGVILSWILAIWPLIVFDINHDYSNILTPIRMIKDKGGSFANGNITDNLNTTFKYFGRLFLLEKGGSNFIETRWSCVQNQSFSYVLSTIIFLGLITYLLNKQSWKKYYKTLTLSFLIILLSFIFYPGSSYEYYLLGLSPLLFIILTIQIIKIKKLTKYLPILSIVLIVSTSTTIMRNDDRYGIGSKKELIKTSLDKTDNKPFYLVESGGCLKSGGWRYLYTVYGDTPSSSSSDGAFGWLYPNDIKQDAQRKITITDKIEDNFTNIGGYGYKIDRYNYE